jgi:hypothetical protein
VDVINQPSCQTYRAQNVRHPAESTKNQSIVLPETLNLQLLKDSFKK